MLLSRALTVPTLSDSAHPLLLLLSSRRLRLPSTNVVMFRSRQRKTLKRKGIREDSPEAAGEDGVAFVLGQDGRLVVDETTIRFRDESPSKRSRIDAECAPTATVEPPPAVDDDDDDEAWEDEEPEAPEPPVSN